MYLVCQQEPFGLPSTGRWPGSGRLRSRSRLRDHGARTWERPAFTPGMEFTRGAGWQQAIRVTGPSISVEIRRSEEIVGVLAGTRLRLPAPMLHDPAVALLSAR